MGGALHAGMARFWVRDNGTTLSAAQRGRVFIPFTRLHQDRAAGHGLGLATVQRIVSRLGGDVGAAPGRRAAMNFIFRFRSPHASASLERHRMKILHADGPLPCSAKELGFFLKLLDPGVVTLEASNVQSALDKLALEAPVDLMLLDLEMPGNERHRRLPYDPAQDIRSFPSSSFPD